MKRTGAWFSLIAYCAAAALVAALALAVVFSGATALVGAFEAEAQAADIARMQTFTGMITDGHCGARHVSADKSSAVCARMCVRNGSPYSLIDGDKRYRLLGMYDQLDEVAGQRATIFGALDGNIIQVSSITPESSTQP
jgi:hypothetical protein